MALGDNLSDPAKDQVLRRIAGEIGEIVGVELDVNDDGREFITSFVQFANQGEFQVW